jgi:hypothetical protein
VGRPHAFPVFHIPKIASPGGSPCRGSRRSHARITSRPALGSPVSPMHICATVPWLSDRISTVSAVVDLGTPSKWGGRHFMALLSQVVASHKYEISATPCVESETDRAPSKGVAETLLHETAGRESGYGDLLLMVAAGDWLRLHRGGGDDANPTISCECIGAAPQMLASCCRVPSCQGKAGRAMPSPATRQDQQTMIHAARGSEVMSYQTSERDRGGTVVRRSSR